MSLFACEECGVIENTALAGWTADDAGHRRLICSECSPSLGKWHDLFPREPFTEADWEKIPNSRYVQRKPVS